MQSRPKGVLTHGGTDSCSFFFKKKLYFFATRPLDTCRIGCRERVVSIDVEHMLHRTLAARLSEEPQDGRGHKVLAALAGSVDGQPRRELARARPPRVGAYMVKGSEIGILDAARLQSHDLSVGSKTLVLSSRVLRVAPRLQMQSDEPVVAKMPL